MLSEVVLIEESDVDGRGIVERAELQQRHAASDQAHLRLGRDGEIIDDGCCPARRRVYYIARC